jgi:DNA-directed RNA polymerase subunit RPC12/RpoP
LTTSVYFGIDCRRCDQRIPLVEVISGPRIYQWFVPRVRPFQVRCERCGSTRIYRFRHVIVFEAPTIEDLDTHPAFRNV